MIIGFDASRAFDKERTGTENYSYQLLKAIVRVDRKNKYVVYTRGPVPFKGSTLQGRADLRVQPIRWSRLWTQGGLALQTWRDKLDVLFVPAHTLPILRKPGLPTVVTIHGLEYEYLPEYYKFPQKLYLTWSTRYAVRSATKLISVSEFTKSELLKRLGADESKVQVVHEGVDTLLYSKIYKDEEKNSTLKALGVKKPYVLFVGVVQPRKNLARLIEAYAKLVQGLNSRKINLVIAGKLGWMYGEIIEAPKKYGVENRVKFLGFVGEKHLPILFQEAEILFQPSLTEGFGLPVLEAMAAGTVVVAAKAGALPEVVGEAGLLIDPLSVEEMSDAMKLVLTNQDLREGLREKGLKRVKEFSWEKTAKETLRVLEEAVEGNNR
jgi:glycosyltransferase involved in cell wall biosynthesis